MSNPLLALLVGCAIAYVFDRTFRRWVNTGVVIIVCALIAAVGFVYRRFDEVPDRRRDWQLAHAARCRDLAEEYRARGDLAATADALLMDRLAVMFDLDAAA